MTLTVNLGLLEGAGLIQLASVQPELEYLFRHVLVKDAAYHSLVKSDRRALHRAVGEALERRTLGPGQKSMPSELYPLLAYHFAEAGDVPRALHYLVIAGDAAFDHYANVEAASFYWQALESANALEAEFDSQLMRHLFSRHGRALELTSRFDAALDNYRAMERTAQQRGDKAMELAAVMARATIHSTANTAQDLPQAVGLLEQASALAHNLGDPVAEAKINWTLLLNNSMAGGDAAQSIGYGQRALELARSRNERELMAFVLTDLWFAFGGAGRWDEARAALQDGVAIAREVDGRSIEAEGLGRLALTDLVAGRYDECLAETAQAMQVAERLNSDDSRALTRVPLAIVYTDRGDVDRAISMGEQAIRFGATTGNVTVLIGTRGDLARSYALLGDIDHGLELTQQASEDANRFQLIAAWAGSATVQLRLRRGDLAGAEAALAELPNYRDLMRRTGFVPVMWSNLGLAAIELDMARGDMSAALVQARELIRHFEQRGVVFVRPEARLLQGQAHMALGQYDDAWAALQKARAEAEALGSRRLLWPILAALAEIASARGQDEASSLRQQAREIVDYIAAHAPTPALRQSFLARAEVQSLLKAVG